MTEARDLEILAEVRACRAMVEEWFRQQLRAAGIPEADIAARVQAIADEAEKTAKDLCE